MLRVGILQPRLDALSRPLQGNRLGVFAVWMGKDPASIKALLDAPQNVPWILAMCLQQALAVNHSEPSFASPRIHNVPHG